MSDMYAALITAFLEIPPSQFKLVLDSVIWAFKHTMRNVSEIGLDILYTMLKNMSQTEQAAQNFYSLYYTDIIQHVFSVVADSVHTGGQYSSLPLTPHRSLLLITPRSSSLLAPRHSFLLTFNPLPLSPSFSPFLPLSSLSSLILIPYSTSSVSIIVSSLIFIQGLRHRLPSWRICSTRWSRDRSQSNWAPTSLPRRTCSLSSSSC